MNKTILDRLKELEANCPVFRTEEEIIKDFEKWDNLSQACTIAIANRPELHANEPQNARFYEIIRKHYPEE